MLRPRCLSRAYGRRNAFDMKSPKPAIPRCAPPGTVWFGGPIEWFSITLRISSENLVPEQVTKLLGCEPDEAQQKGKPILRPDGTVMRIAKSGAWRLTLKPNVTDEWDCAEAMMPVLERLPKAMRVWRQLTKEHAVDFFVGLSMASHNKGFELPPAVMKYLGERGISAGFDIYYDGGESAEGTGPPNHRTTRPPTLRRKGKGLER